MAQFKKVVAVGLADKTLRILWSQDGLTWNHEDCEGHSGAIQGAHVTSGGHVVSWSNSKKDGGAKAWSWDSRGFWGKWNLGGPAGELTSMVAFPSGEVATGSKDKVIFTYWAKPEGGWGGKKLGTTPAKPESMAVLADGGLAVQLDAGVMTWRNRGAVGDWVFRGGPKWEDASNDLFRGVWASPTAGNFVTVNGSVRQVLYEWAETPDGWKREELVPSSIYDTKMIGKDLVVLRHNVGVVRTMAKIGVKHLKRTAGIATTSQDFNDEGSVGLINPATKRVKWYPGIDIIVKDSAVLPSGEVVLAGSAGKLKIFDPFETQMQKEELTRYVHGFHIGTGQYEWSETVAVTAMDSLTSKNHVGVGVLSATEFVVASEDNTLRYISKVNGTWAVRMDWTLPKAPVVIGARGLD